MKSDSLLQCERVCHQSLNANATPGVLFGLSKFSYTMLHAYQNLAYFDGSCNSGISSRASQLGASQTSSNMLDDAPLEASYKCTDSTHYTAS